MIPYMTDLREVLGGDNVVTVGSTGEASCNAALTGCGYTLTKNVGAEPEIQASNNIASLVLNNTPTMG